MTEDIPVTTAADGTYSATIVRSDEATYEARPRRGITFARPFYFPAPPADLGTVHIMDLFREYSQWVPSLVLPVPGGGSGTGGTTDHGALTGLLDDDHPQYALADGSRGLFASTAQGAKADTAVQPAALAAHEADTTNVHGITDTSALVVTTDPRLASDPTLVRLPTVERHPNNLLQHDPGDHPVVLAQNEGLNILNLTAMGAAGVGFFYVNLEFAEAVSY